MRFVTTFFALLASACAAAPRAAEQPARAAWRFESVLFDVPLSIAERFHRAADEHEPALAVLIDERDVRAQLEELARSAVGVERAVRPVIVVAEGARALLPPRVDIDERAMGALASDWLAITLGARGGHEWAECNVDFELEWVAAGPQRIAGDTPQPGDHFLIFMRTPARNSAQKKAVFAFVRAHAATLP